MDSTFTEIRTKWQNGDFLDNTLTALQRISSDSGVFMSDGKQRSQVSLVTQKIVPTDVGVKRSTKDGNDISTFTIARDGDLIVGFWLEDCACGSCGSCGPCDITINVGGQPISQHTNIGSGKDSRVLFVDNRTDFPIIAIKYSEVQMDVRNWKGAEPTIVIVYAFLERYSRLMVATSINIIGFNAEEQKTHIVSGSYSEISRSKLLDIVQRKASMIMTPTTLLIHPDLNAYMK